MTPLKATKRYKSMGWTCKDHQRTTVLSRVHRLLCDPNQSWRADARVLMEETKSQKQVIWKQSDRCKSRSARVRGLRENFMNNTAVSNPNTCTRQSSRLVLLNHAVGVTQRKGGSTSRSTAASIYTPPAECLYDRPLPGGAAPAAAAVGTLSCPDLSQDAALLPNIYGAQIDPIWWLACCCRFCLRWC